MKPILAAGIFAALLAWMFGRKGATPGGTATPTPRLPTTLAEMSDAELAAHERAESDQYFRAQEAWKAAIRRGESGIEWRAAMDAAQASRLAAVREQTRRRG